MEITVEQALQNLQIVCDNFVGKKSDHIALEQSMKKLRETLSTNAAEEATNAK